MGKFGAPPDRGPGSRSCNRGRGACITGAVAAAARVGGHIAVIGIWHDGNPAVAHGSYRGSCALVVGHRRWQMDMIRAIDAIGLRPVIDRHFSLEQIVEAFRYQESRHHSARYVLISDTHFDQSKAGVRIARSRLTATGSGPGRRFDARDTIAITEAT